MENNIFKIRVVADIEEDIFIDLIADKNCNLIGLHNVLLKSFGLNEMEMASFYLSNDNWDKGEEITLFNMEINEEENSPKSMGNTFLNDLFKDNICKILYLHDFLNLNIFYIEILNEEYHEIKPNEILITHQLGKYTAKEYNETDDLSNDEESDPIKDILDEYDEDDIGGFEELDEDLY